MGEFRIWRSLLFIPANNWKMLNRAVNEGEDGVLIDLEDACPFAELETGRVFARDIAPVLKSCGIDVLVRVNAFSTGLTELDLSVVFGDSIDGIMLPKVETPEDVVRLSRMLEKEEKDRNLSKKLEILPLIESPKGIINAYGICRASERVSAIGFGAGDFMRELGEGFTITRMSPEEYFPVLLTARSNLAMAACAVGVNAIDTPFFGLLIDAAGLEQEAVKAKMLGFKGKMVTHPRHINTVNNVFSPSESEVDFSRQMVEAYRAAEAEGKGAAVLDGKMIDIAMFRMGMDLLSKAEKIEEKAALRQNKGKESMWIPGH